MLAGLGLFILIASEILISYLWGIKIGAAAVLTALAGAAVGGAPEEPVRVTIAEEGGDSSTHKIFVLHWKTARGHLLSVRVIPGKELEEHFHTGALPEFKVNGNGVVTFGKITFDPNSKDVTVCAQIDMALFAAAKAIKPTPTAVTATAATPTAKSAGNGAKAPATAAQNSETIAIDIDWLDAQKRPRFAIKIGDCRIRLYCFRGSSDKEWLPYFVLFNTNKEKIKSKLEKIIPGLKVDAAKMRFDILSGSLTQIAFSYGSNPEGVITLSPKDPEREKDCSILIGQLNAVVELCAADQKAKAEKAGKKEEPPASSVILPLSEANGKNPPEQTDSSSLESAPQNDGGDGTKVPQDDAKPSIARVKPVVSLEEPAAPKEVLLNAWMAGLFGKEEDMLPHSLDLNVRRFERLCALYKDCEVVPQEMTLRGREVKALDLWKAGDINLPEFIGFYLTSTNRPGFRYIGNEVIFGNACWLQVHIQDAPHTIEPLEYEHPALLGLAQDSNYKFIFIISKDFRSKLDIGFTMGLNISTILSDHYMRFMTLDEIVASKEELTLIHPIKPKPQTPILAEATPAGAEAALSALVLSLLYAMPPHSAANIFAHITHWFSALIAAPWAQVAVAFAALACMGMCVSPAASSATPAKEMDFRQVTNTVAERIINNEGRREVIIADSESTALDIFWYANKKSGYGQRFVLMRHK